MSKRIALRLWEMKRIMVLREYARLRRIHFKESVPDPRHVSIVFLSPAVMNKNTDGDECDGFCVWDRDNTIALIAIRDNCTPLECRETLKHEMVHMKVEVEFNFRNMGHGKHWKAEMKIVDPL
jgi:hypothetical protein